MLAGVGLPRSPPLARCARLETELRRVLSIHDGAVRCKGMVSLQQLQTMHRSLTIMLAGSGTLAVRGTLIAAPARANQALRALEAMRFGIYGSA